MLVQSYKLKVAGKLNFTVSQSQSKLKIVRQTKIDLCQ